MNYDLLNYMAAKQPDPDPNDRDGIQETVPEHIL